MWPLECNNKGEGRGGHCILKKKGAGVVGAEVGGYFNLYTSGHPITPSKSICIFKEVHQVTSLFYFLLIYLIFFRRRRFVSQIYPR